MFMMVIKNATQLLTLDDNDSGIIENGSVCIKNSKITSIVSKLKISDRSAKIIDASGCIVLPSFVDCHTHLVFAGTRTNEFAMRLEGKSYKEILKAGGGILQTVSATRKATEKQLFNLAQQRINEIISWGTTTIEIKSGYGLDIDSELKILRVIKQLQLANKTKITIVPTFLGAHTVPSNRQKDEYIKEIITEMIPAVAKQNLAQFCDVFCENFVFNAQESKKILETAKKFGMIPKIHADEIESSGGAEIAGLVKAISAEHLLFPSDQGLKAMKKSNVTAVLLPGTTLFLKSKHIPPIDKMRKLGLTIALGSDYNPGTCMIYQMPIIIALGCLLYNMSLVEAIRGVTINSAKALGMDNQIGSIKVGKNADLLILDVSDYRQIPYQFGKNLIKTVIKNGNIVYSRN